MGKVKGRVSDLLKSGFVRSVITRILAIFVIISILIAAVTFFTFTSEMRSSKLADKQRQLAAVENTISERMQEITSIAYNIGNDPVFYLEPVDDDPNSGREMSEMLSRYIVGNNFIEHLAYCRTAEPDKIYICSGERSLSEFFTTTFGMDAKTAEFTIQQIHRDNKNGVRSFGGGEHSYFAYSYPLPQLAATPLAHVLMMIPAREVRPLLEALCDSEYSLAAVFDGEGNEIFRVGELEDEVELSDFVRDGSAEEEYRAPSGQSYVLQKVVSQENNWSYVSVMRYGDTLSGLAKRQTGLIAFILLLLVGGIAFMLLSIISQYKPISNLAAQVAQAKQDGAADAVIDERTLLSDTIATLKDDSEQKQKYETAFYEAEAANKAKSAFLSSMSHDIRTPMNAIIGMTAIARKHIGDQEYVDECLEKVQISSDYLLNIINNVLDMSRIESGRIPIAEEPVVIPALIDSVVSLMTSSIEAKAQRLHVNIGELEHATVLGDNTHLVQVFVNIVSNAVKFTPQGGDITISVCQKEAFDNSGSYSFVFSDTGVGIPPEFIDKVFDTFTRAEGHGASETEGTGLGMAIAKKLVELMGGNISCRSEPGRGTTFTVVLPMEYAKDIWVPTQEGNAESQHRGQLKDDAVVDLSGKRILLVEDNAMNREIAKRIIAETGAEITQANDGRQAVDAFIEHPEGYFDLIFMDIQMPVMNGYEATEAIRTMERSDAASVPIYAMTANTFDEDVRQVKDAGMNGHVGKPYNPQTLYQVLSQVLG